MKKKYLKVFITGGGGYVGTVLTHDLLSKGYEVTVYDKFFYGDFIKRHKNLKIINGDIRDINLLNNSIFGHEVFIHLACISNDTSFALDEKLSTDINLRAFEPIVKSAKNNKVKLFIYASTSSVYGLSNKKDVKEDHPLKPITLYNDFKGRCEPILLDYLNENFNGVIFRPATVCGYSPRMRFDLTVNVLTKSALQNNLIKVFGGEQLRPNLHIQDYCSLINLFLNIEAEKINGEIFNVGYENYKVKDLAILVKNTIENNFKDFEKIEIEYTKSDDPRSYHINSDKIFNFLGVKAKHKIEDAVIEICNAYYNKDFKENLDHIEYYNVKTLLKKGFK